MKKSMLELIEETQRVLLEAAVEAAKKTAPESNAYRSDHAVNYATAAKTLVDAAHTAASLGMFHK